MILWGVSSHARNPFIRREIGFMHSILNPGFYVSVSCKAQSKWRWNHLKPWWLNAMLILTLLGFTNSTIALLCLPQFSRSVSWEEIESHKKPLVVLREIGFMHSMSTHGFMSGMRMKFLVKFSLWHVHSISMFNCLCACNLWVLFHAGASQEFDNEHCEASKDICPWSAQHPIFTKKFRLGIAKWFCTPGKFLPNFHSPPRLAICGSSSRLPFLPFSIQHRFTCNLAYMVN